MNIICFLIGHKTIDDNGYLICKRCKKSEYYDYATWDKSGYLLNKPINHIKSWWWNFINFKWPKIKVKIYKNTNKNDTLPF